MQRTKHGAVRGGRYSAVLCLLVPIMPWKSGRRLHCVAWTPVSLRSTSELDLGSPEGLIPPRRGIQRRRQTVLTATSATGDHLRAQPYQPSLQGNLLCRSDWLRVRGVAETECMILPIRELAAFLGRSVCVHRSSRRVGPCRPRCRSTNSAGSQIECLGLGTQAGQTAPAPGAQTVSTTLTRLETASGSGRRVVAKERLGPMSPSVSLVSAPLLRARVNMVTAERWAKNPLGVVQNIRNLTNLALVSSPNIVDSLPDRCF